MQTQDVVEGLHNCREFTQPSSCSDEAMWKPRKSALLLNSFFIIKKVDSMLPCVCFVKDHRWRQNVIRLSLRMPHIGSQPCQEPVEVGTHERTSPCNSQGEGCYLTKFIMGRLRPEVQHLVLFYTILVMGSWIWQKRYPFYLKNVPPSHIYLRKSYSHFHVVLNK